ncbi:MAG: AI-2E family transporter [bacterium]
MTDLLGSRSLRLAIQVLLPILVLFLVFIFWGRQIWVAAAPFVIALVLAYMLYPLVIFLQRRACRGRRLTAVVLLYVLVLVVVIPMITILIVGVVGEMFDLYGKLPQYWENIQGIGRTVVGHLPAPIREKLDAALQDPEQLRRIWERSIAPVLAPVAAAGGRTPSVSDVVREVSATGVGQSMTKSVGDVVGGMAAVFRFALSKVISWTGGAVTFVTTLVLVVIGLFYLLLDYEKLGAAIPRFVPPVVREEFCRIWNAIDKQLSGFLRGQITVAICVGILSAILYTIAGVDFGILIGLFAGVCNVIPYLGSIMGFLPAVVSTIVEQYANGMGATIWQLVWVCVAFGVIQAMEGLVIGPRVMSTAVNLHPVMIMFALILGGSLGGILGMLLAVPVACVVRILIHELYLKPMESSSDSTGS